MKILATGIIVMMVSGMLMRAIGSWPGIAKGLPLLLGWFGGVAAIVVGVLVAIWG